jgi:ParB-like chromosome segregation protein Spo0J
MLCPECSNEYQSLAIRLAATPRDSEIMVGAYKRKLKKKELAEAFGLTSETIAKAFSRTTDRVSGYCATKHGEASKRNAKSL